MSPAAYLGYVAACAPVQFCSRTPYGSRRQAVSILHRLSDAPKHAASEVYQCDDCGHWHIRTRKKAQAGGRSAK